MTSSSVLGLSLCLSVATLAASVSAQEEAETAVDPRSVAIRSAVDYAVAEGELAVMIGVVRRGSVLLTHAAGTMDRKRPVAEDTLFPMGEASKALAGLAFARLHGDGSASLDREFNPVLAPFTLQVQQGGAFHATLRDLIHGRVRLPRHRNFVRLEDVAKWPTRRAVVEHAVVLEGMYAGGLGYAAVQVATEIRHENSWSALVRRTVTRPLGMGETIPDARTGLPTNRVHLFRPGLFGLSLPETRFYSSIPAAHGAWVSAGDAGRLLGELLRLAKDASTLQDMRDLAAERVEFAAFTPVASPHPHLRLTGGIPGSRGGLVLYPQFQTGWAVFTSSTTVARHGIPGGITGVLVGQLLPREKSGVPSGTGLVSFGGRAVRRVPKPSREEWLAKVRFQGVDHDLRMWVREDGVHAMQFDDRKVRTKPETGSRNRLAMSGRVVIPIPTGTYLRQTRVELVYEGSGADARYVGTVTVDGEHCHLVFQVTFRKVE